MTAASPALTLRALSYDALLASLAEDTPVPGGGSAAALAGAMGAALVVMTARLTLGRPRYAAAAQEMREVVARALACREGLLELAEDDAQAYRAVVQARRMPKDSDREKEERARAEQQALMQAAKVPLKVAEACVEVLNLAVSAVSRGNRNAASDAAVGALLAHAGLRGAVVNVCVNLRGLTSDDFCEYSCTRLSELLDSGEKALEQAVSGAGE
jgi:formiminotetrahydrofolate cyclodeaminase